MTRHVAAAALARYREGELSRRRAARIGAHLASCATCAALSSDLAAVSRVLAGVQLPGIPDHLAARLHSALASEAAARTAGTASQAAGEAGSGAVNAGAGAPARPPGRPERTKRSGRPRQPLLSPPPLLRTLAVAGAVAVVAGGGYLTFRQIASGPGPTALSSSHAGLSGRAAAPERPHGSERRGDVQYAQFAQNGIIHTVPVIHSGVNLTQATLAAQIRGDIARAGSANGSGTAPVTPGPAGVTAGGAAGVPALALQGCVSLVSAGRDVLLVDLASYEGEPATVIVTAKSPTARTLFVSVVGRRCSAAHADLIASVTIPAS